MKLEKIKKRLFCSVKVTVLCNGVIRKRLNFAVQSSISWDEWRAGFANPSGLSRVIADSLPSPWKGEPIVRTSCLINHWCFLWRRLRAWVTVKGQCELDATYIQVWDLFLFFSMSPLAQVHIAPRYPSSLAFPLYLCHHTSNPPPPQKKKKNHLPRCAVVLQTLIAAAAHLLKLQCAAATAEELINIGKKTTYCLDSRAAH